MFDKFTRKYAPWTALILSGVAMLMGKPLTLIYALGVIIFSKEEFNDTMDSFRSSYILNHRFNIS